MKIIILLLAGCGIAALAAAGFAYSGWYDVSATTPHSRVVRWFLSTTSDASIERRAQDVDVPDLSDDRLLVAGAGDFDAMCAGCHGAPGRDSGPVGRGLNPAPPDLAEEAAEMSPAELFWVTKNGIRMTGMPAWGITHDDTELWPIVAFLRELPALDAASYQKLVAQSGEVGHHDAAHEHTESPPRSTDSAHPQEESIQSGQDSASSAESHDHAEHEHSSG
jgi:mono/diheme cytochrome c family protein